MKPTLLFSLLYFFAISSYAQTELPEFFKYKLRDAKVSLTQPLSADQVPVLKNELVQYDYAVKVKGKDVEVRYLVWPLTEAAYIAYDKREKKEGDSTLHPDKLHLIIASQLFNRIAGDTLNTKKIQVQKLSAEGLKKDFGADAGGLYMGAVAPGFAKDYKYGFFMFFHKDHAGDIYVFHLFKDQEAMIKEQQSGSIDQSILKAIRFK